MPKSSNREDELKLVLPEREAADNFGCTASMIAKGRHSNLNG